MCVLQYYLHEPEFLQVFGMDLAAWEKQPNWKRSQVKKRLDMF